MLSPLLISVHSESDAHAGTLEEMVYARQIYKQQAANTAIEGSRERRYFEGVKGMPGHEGELWGLANLFKLTAETVATRDIISEADKRELRYDIQSFDADQAGGCNALVEIVVSVYIVPRNPFKMTAETVATRDFLSEADRRELKYDIQSFDAEQADVCNAAV